MTNPSLPLVHELIRTACSAPSVHNTQPWSWRVLDTTALELYADRSRQLHATDPRGRDLALSCGAALHHLVIAARAFGLVAEVSLLPSREDKELLAHIRLSPGEIENEAVEWLSALENRLTDRRGFSSWEVPTERLRHLCESASDWGAYAFPLTDPWTLHRAEELLEQARHTQAADPEIAQELETWTDRLDPGAVEGIPTGNTVPRQRDHLPRRPTRFERVRPETSPRDQDGETEPETSHGLVAICTTRDDLRSWLTAGQTMSAVWLGATLSGMAATAVSQVIEVDSTRRVLQRELFAYTGRPQILLRIGWPDMSRPALPHTPRRALEDVLRS
jgi:hypothetical protein